LPSAALGKEHSANKVTAKTTLPSVFFRALGKGFTESKKTLGKIKLGDRRKRHIWLFAECQMEKHSAKSGALPSVFSLTLGKVVKFGFFEKTELKVYE